MRWKSILVVYTGLLLLLTGTYLLFAEENRHMEECKRIEAMEPVYIHDTIWIKTDFPKTVKAIIEVESHGNPEAVNSSSGATGLMQLMPIYVREANRILGEEVYTLEDRLSPVKTLEMFCIIQDYHNPSQDVNRAISLHNKGKEYYNLVKSKM